MRNKYDWRTCLVCCLAAALAIFLSLAVPRTAQAHRVLLFAWVEGGMIHAEGGFGGGKAAKNCELKAFNDKKQLMFTGKTDDEGNCIFKIPSGHSGELVLELDAGPGHKGRWTMGADEFKTAASTPSVEIAQHHEDMEEGADPVKIVAGIVVIFGLALAAGLLKKRGKGDADA